MPVSVGIHIEARGLNRALSGLDQVQRSLTDTSPLWDHVIENAVIPKLREVFRTNGYGRWPPRQDNLPHPLLRKSFDLFNSLTDRAAPGHVERRTASSLEYGTDIPYADVHEFGAGPVPPRPYFQSAVDSGLENDVAREVDRYFESRFNQI